MTVAYAPKVHENLTKYRPEGSEALPAKSGGRCIVCDREFGKPFMLLRALYLDDDGKVRGHKVCYHCSPHVADLTVQRYVMDLDDWEYNWLASLDGRIERAS